MSRRRYIFLYVGLSLVWGFGAYNQWRTSSWEMLPSLSITGAINLFLTPMLALLSLGQLLQMLIAPKAERIVDPHATVEMGETHAVRLFSWLALSLYTAAGIWGLMQGPTPFAVFGTLPLSAIMIFAIGLFGLVVLTLNPRARMILSPDGLSHNRVRPGTIAWEELADVQAKKFFGSTILTLVLRDTREFRGASLLAGWRRLDKLTLNPITFGVDPDVLHRGIELRRNVFTF